MQGMGRENCLAHHLDQYSQRPPWTWLKKIIFRKEEIFQAHTFFVKCCTIESKSGWKYGGGGGLLVVFTWYWCGQNEGQ